MLSFNMVFVAAGPKKQAYNTHNIQRKKKLFFTSVPKLMWRKLIVSHPEGHAGSHLNWSIMVLGK